MFINFDTQLHTGDTRLHAQKAWEIVSVSPHPAHRSLTASLRQDLRYRKTISYLCRLKKLKAVCLRSVNRRPCVLILIMFIALKVNNIVK